jgi:hypothetical protein
MKTVLLGTTNCKILQWNAGGLSPQVYRTEIYVKHFKKGMNKKNFFGCYQLM